MVGPLSSVLIAGPAPNRLVGGRPLRALHAPPRKRQEAPFDGRSLEPAGATHRAAADPTQAGPLRKPRVRGCVRSGPRGSPEMAEREDLPNPKSPSVHVGIVDGRPFTGVCPWGHGGEVRRGPTSGHGCALPPGTAAERGAVIPPVDSRDRAVTGHLPCRAVVQRPSTSFDQRAGDCPLPRSPAVRVAAAVPVIRARTAGRPAPPPAISPAMPTARRAAHVCTLRGARPLRAAQNHPPIPPSPDPHTFCDAITCDPP